LRSHGISQEGWTLTQNNNVPEQCLAHIRDLIADKCTQSMWGWKDPRTTLFLDFWLKELPFAKFLFVYRSPWQVIDSLFRRSHKVCDDTFFENPSFALEVWQSYNEAILNFYHENNKRCVLVNIESVIHDFNLIKNKLESKLEIHLNWADALNTYDDRLFKRQVSESHRQTLINQYFPDAMKCYQQLNNIADIKYEDHSITSSEDLHLSNLKAWILQDWLDVKKVQKELQETQLQLQENRLQLEQLKNNILVIESSKFWKLRNFWFNFKSALR
jgi:hypothetical protein